MNEPQFKPVADRALLVEFGTVVDDDINRAVIALDHALARSCPVGLLEVIPAMVNLLIIFDPVLTDHRSIQEQVEKLFPLDLSGQENAKHHSVNVCYEEQFGPDLKTVATACDLSVDAVINAHSGPNYRVSMYGFAPGFAYLSGVPCAIQVPRKEAAIRDIAAGSVLIAGPQCLTTTMLKPTGWSIIGRSDVRVMTDDPEHPFLFDIGDTVSFKRISADELKWVAP